MKDFIITIGLALGIVAVIFGAFAFVGWVLSLALNIALNQMGLGEINTWAGMGILAGCTVIKKWIDW